MKVGVIFSARLRTRASPIFQTPFERCVKPTCRCVTRLVVTDSKKPIVPGPPASLYVKLLVAPQEFGYEFWKAQGSHPWAFAV